jgi:hypothetical protein
VAGAADRDLFIIGPAITPRLIVEVYNHRERGDELLGSAQMSISNVLSGSGIGRLQWVNLLYATSAKDGDTNKNSYIQAGEVEIELGFRKKSSLDGDEKAEKDRKLRNSNLKKAEHEEYPNSRVVPVTPPKLPIPAASATKVVSEPFRDPTLENKRNELEDMNNKAEQLAELRAIELEEHINLLAEHKILQQICLLYEQENKESKLSNMKHVSEEKVLKKEKVHLDVGGVLDADNVREESLEGLVMEILKVIY